MIIPVHISTKNNEGINLQQEYNSTEKLIEAAKMTGTISDPGVNENLKIQVRALKNMGLNTSKLDQLLNPETKPEKQITTPSIYSY